MNNSQKSCLSSFSSFTKLLDFQPLAVYLNCLLQTFNDFRLSLPINLFIKVNGLVKESLGKMCAHLSAYYKKEKASFDKNENDFFLNFLYHLAYVLVPFVEKCLSFLFSHEQLQKVFSFSQSDLDKLKNGQKFEIKTLMSDLHDLVPVRKEMGSHLTANKIEIDHVKVETNETQTDGNVQVLVEESKVKSELNSDLSLNLVNDNVNSSTGKSLIE